MKTVFFASKCSKYPLSKFIFLALEYFEIISFISDELSSRAYTSVFDALLSSEYNVIAFPPTESKEKYKVLTNFIVTFDNLTKNLLLLCSRTS